MRRAKRRVVVILVLAWLAAMPACRADDAPLAGQRASDQWRLIMPAYFWLSGLVCNVTVQGHKANVGLSFGDIVDHTDIGFQTYAELRKEKFGFYAQPNYLKLSASGSANGVKADLDSQLWIVEAGGFYQVGKWGAERPLTIEALAGVRYWNLHDNVTVTEPGPVVVKAANTDWLIDPLVGLRARKNWTEKFFTTVQADVGGFGVSSDSSDFTWQVVPLVGYEFNKWFSVAAGYCALGLQERKGSGVDENSARITMHGVLIGFNFDFFEWRQHRK